MTQNVWLRLVILQCSLGIKDYYVNHSQLSPFSVLPVVISQNKSFEMSRLVEANITWPGKICSLQLFNKSQVSENVLEKNI